jgi:hypothetical protein
MRIKRPKSLGQTHGGLSYTRQKLVNAGYWTGLISSLIMV